MAKKKKNKTAQTQYAEGDDNYEVALHLPKSVRGNMRLLSQLHARVGELMADHGLGESIVEDMEVCLRMLSGRVMAEYVNDMFRKTIAADEARRRTAATTAPVKPKTSTRKESKCKAARKTLNRTKEALSRRKKVGRG